MTKPGSNNSPEFDYHRAPPADSLFAPAGPEEAQLPIVEAPGVEPVIKPVSEIMAEHAIRETEKATKKEELTDANWLPGRIEEALDRLFPDLVSPEKIEKQNQERDKQANHRAAANGGTHPTGPRGKKYHFDNKTKSVESAYEGHG